MSKVLLIGSLVAVIGLAFVYGGITYIGAQTSGLVSGDINKTSLLAFKILAKKTPPNSLKIIQLIESVYLLDLIFICWYQIHFVAINKIDLIFSYYLFNSHFTDFLIYLRYFIFKS